jgi:hypothetical protein
MGVNDTRNVNQVTGGGEEEQKADNPHHPQRKCYRGGQSQKKQKETHYEKAKSKNGSIRAPSVFLTCKICLVPGVGINDSLHQKGHRQKKSANEYHQIEIYVRDAELIMRMHIPLNGHGRQLDRFADEENTIDKPENGPDHHDYPTRLALKFFQQHGEADVPVLGHGICA